MTTRVHFSPSLVFPPSVLVFGGLVGKVNIAVRAGVKVLLREVRQLVVLQGLRVGRVEFAGRPMPTFEEFF